MTQTMTKEQILKSWFCILAIPATKFTTDMALKAMEEYAQQQLSAERERAWKLVDALQKLAWHLDRLKQYDIVELIKQTLNDYDTATKES